MVGTSTIADGGVYRVPETIGREIFKNPITDDGTKKSATGLLRVVWDPFIEDYQLLDKQTWDQENLTNNQLKSIYIDGKFMNEITLSEIREKLKK